MSKTMIARPNWKAVDEVDLHPLPGSFVSPTMDDYEVHGETIHALNWLHAEYLWLQRAVERSGEEWETCCQCHHAIRYAVVFEDAEGGIHLVGRDCAAFLVSGLDRRPEFIEKRRLSEIKTLTTKRGERAVLSFEVPGWFWALPKEQRPAFVSLSRYEGGRRSTWYLSIWGETVGEVVENWKTFQALRA